MAAETIVQVKNSMIAGAAITAATGADYSLWQYDGMPSGGAVPPTTFANPDNTTTGGIMQTDPAGGVQKWMTALAVSGLSGQGMLVLYDRLLHMSGFVANTGSVQNLNGGSPATLTRHYADVNGGTDIGNEIWIEIYTQLGATPTTVTASYKNQAGTTQTTRTVTIGGTGFMEVQRFIKLPLAAGDTGVQSVISVTLAGSTGTAGNFGVVVTHRLLDFVLVTGQPEVWTGAAEGNIEILTHACLAWSYALVQFAVTDRPPFWAFFTFGDK